MMSSFTACEEQVMSQGAVFDHFFCDAHSRTLREGVTDRAKESNLVSPF